MEHPKEPVMDDAAIAPFLDQPVAAIILWCTSGRPRHWITSYEFQQLLVSEKNTRTPVLRAVASASDVDRTRYDCWEGVSFDMFQPQNHVYFNPPPMLMPGVLPQNNLFGSLRVQPRPYEKLRSQSAGLAVTVPINAAIRVTVRDLLKVVTDGGLQYYRYNPDGSGCLYWHLQLLERFVRNGWLAREEVNNVAREVEQFAVQANSRVPWPPVQGTYYKISDLNK